MMENKVDFSFDQAFSFNLIIGVIVLVTGVTCIGVWLEEYWIALLIPLCLTATYLISFHLKILFRLLFFTIPLSMELELPGGFSTDFPGEPILWLLFISVVFLIAIKGIPKQSINIISAFLYVHWTWIVVVSLFALIPFISFKYSLAKIWYILPFYLLPFFLFKDPGEIRSIFKFFITGLLLASVYFFINHYLLDLTYMDRTNAGKPIWRNHVNYACTLIISMPMLWYLWKTSRHPDRWIYIFLTGLFLFFSYFAFARISYICIAAVIIYYFILKLKLTRSAIAITLMSTGVLVVFLAKNNTYLSLAPHYDKAIMQLDFDRKISATTTGEDISTMERLHRWVAGSNMITARPLLGFGPGNYYSAYRPYSVYSFETYVSDNPERSGIHNYYLMVLVEQGIIGFLIFLSLITIALCKIERVYHKAKTNELKCLSLAVGCIIIMILSINAINDMIEVIKIGGIFFFILFLIVKSEDFEDLEIRE